MPLSNERSTTEDSQGTIATLERRGEIWTHRFTRRSGLAFTRPGKISIQDDNCIEKWPLKAHSLAQARMNFLTLLIVAAVVSLAAAWAVNSFIGMLSGDKPESLLRDWWDIFSNIGRSPINYTEPLPGVLKPGKFNIGSRIRLLPLSLAMEHAMSKERVELFRRCTGKVFRVDSIDQFGALEIHVLNDGSQNPDRYDHVLYIDPEFAELAGQTG